MPNKKPSIAAGPNIQKHLFWALAAITLISLFAAIGSGYYVLAGLPAVALLAFWVVVDFRKVFFLLLACLPLSTEIFLPNGFGTDLPAEPLMILLTGLFLVYSIRHGKEMSARFFLHPISILLLLHVGWILATTITSENFLVSLKFFLAKVWYVVSFYFLAGMILRRDKDVRAMFWWVLLPLLLTVLYVMARHAMAGFSFASVNSVMNPFYRNHVNYACILALFLPFVWFSRSWYHGKTRRLWFLGGVILLFLVAIQLSFTRVAYGAILIALGAYFVIRWKLTRWAVLAGLLVILGVVVYFLQQDRYLEYAPEYKKTVTHYKFDNLLEATYKGEDISTMERVYRWVAGIQMNEQEPWLGFGPGNFYNFYRSYTVTSFETYVSDNPDKSGIHSYYLMTLVEQGFPGLFIFVAIVIFVLIRGEQIYHQTTDPAKKRLVMMVLLSSIIIDVLLLINDMVETDKVGPFFFLNMAILVNLDLQLKSPAHKADQGSTSTPV